MTAPQQLSLFVFFVTLIVFLLFRHVFFSVSAIGVFLVSNYFLVLLGALLVPWLTDYMGKGVFFAGLAFDKFTEADFMKTMILSGGGILLVFLSYQYTQLIFSKGNLRIGNLNLLRPDFEFRIGVPIRRIKGLTLISILTSLALLLPQTPNIIKGIISMLTSDPSGIIAARIAVTSNYLLVLLVYNIIPFLVISYRMAALYCSVPRMKVMSYIYFLYAVFLLLMTFQKRPLVLFLICWFLMSYWIKKSTKAKILLLEEKINKEQIIQRLTSKKAMLGYGLTVFCLLLVLYYFMTTVGRTGEGFLFTLWTLTLIIITRVLGRLSLPSIMYTHYFPNVDPHYGITNIGMLAAIFGYDLFTDTPIVFHYFYNLEGSVAVSAIFDFYGAFGISGWFIGCIAVGILLHRLDSFLRKLPRTGENILLIIFIFLTVFYFSQASIARSLMGYGGIFFILLWLLLKIRFSPSNQNGGVQR